MEKNWTFLLLIASFFVFPNTDNEIFQDRSPLTQLPSEKGKPYWDEACRIELRCGNSHGKKGGLFLGSCLGDPTARPHNLKKAANCPKNCMDLIMCSP